MAGRITMMEIAKQAGVSIGTVDRVLNNRGRVAKLTRQKVLAIARANNYSSNVSARLLRLNRTFNLATLMPSNLAYWNQQLKGVEEGIKEHEAIGFKHRHYPMLSSTLADSARMLTKVIAEAPDGIILTPNCLASDADLLSKLQESNIPFVFVDVNLENVGQLTFVGQDPFQGGRMAASLLDMGYDEDYELYIVTAEPDDLDNPAIISRIAGLKSYYSENDKTRINHHQIQLAQYKNQAELIEHLKSVRKQIRVFVPNSRSYELVAMLNGLKEALRMRLVGYDLVDENRLGLESGAIDFIIDQQPVNQGKLAVQALYRMLVLNQPVDDVYQIPIDIITAYNLRK